MQWSVVLDLVQCVYSPLFTFFIVLLIFFSFLALSIMKKPSEEQAIEVIHAALDAGVNLIDTADCYCQDESDFNANEKLIAKALASYGSDTSHVLVATKGGIQRPGGDWVPNGDPEYIRSACERSLQALGRTSIDLYQFHAPDPNVPFEKSVEAFAKLKQEGLVKRVGLSNVDQKQISVARKITDISSVQNRCNILYRNDLDSGLIEYCEKHKIAYLPYSPVGG
jgi:aryl-alcohol dehydrogenase-like predicted oxidoreductase